MRDTGFHKHSNLSLPTNFPTNHISLILHMGKIFLHMEKGYHGMYRKHHVSNLTFLFLCFRCISNNLKAVLDLILSLRDFCLCSITTGRCRVLKLYSVSRSHPNSTNLLIKKPYFQVFYLKNK